MCDDKISNEIGALAAVIVVSWVLGTFGTWYAWHYGDNHSGPLHDMFLNVLPDVGHVTTPWPNFIGFAQMALALISLEKYHWAYISQFLFLNCVIITLRALTTSVTILPDIYVYDYCNVTSPGSFFDVVSKQLEHGTCSDYMFSGHTAVVVLLFMFVHRHKSQQWFEYVSFALVITMIFTLLVLRWHYTSDIVIAIVIVFLTFKYYKDYETSNYWYYFPELKKYNWKCKRIGKVEREDYNIIID
jgi:hypothetical protein